MFLMPYDATVATKLYKNLEPLYSKLRLGKIELPYPNVQGLAGETFTDLVYVTPLEEHLDVPSFTQYVNIGDSKNPILAIDGRAYMRANPHTSEIKIIGSNDWRYQIVRMALNLKQFKESESFYMGIGDIPIKVFSRWISGILTNRYNLTIESQMAISVISVLYYLAMINPNLRIRSDLREIELTRICQTTGIDVDFADSIVSNIENLSNLEDLAVAISQHSLQERTGNLKAQDLIMVLGNSWFGINSRENIAIALEHLPSFVSLVHSALTTSLYKRTSLAQYAINVARDREVKTFNDIIFHIVSDHTRR